MSEPATPMTPIGLYSGGINIRDLRIDMSSVLSAILKNDQAFLGKIGGPTGAKAHNTQIEWLEDELNPILLTGDYTYSDDAADPLVVSDPGATEDLKKIIRPGTLLQPQGTNLMYVVDAAEVFGDLTIEITEYNSMGAGNSDVDGSRVWEVVGNPGTHGMDASDDISRARAEKKNFLQLLERAVSIDTTREHMDTFATGTNEKTTQINRRMMELHNELNIACIRIYNHASGVQTNKPTMKGLRQQIEDYGNSDTYKDAGSAVPLTADLINNLVEKMWDLGGLGSDARPHILVNSFQHRKISAFNEDIIRTKQNSKLAGSMITQIQGDIGPILTVVLDRHMPQDSICIFDAGRINLRHLQGDSFGMVPMAITGRRRSWQLSGSYSLEVRNAGQAHSWLYDLSTS